MIGRASTAALAAIAILATPALAAFTDDDANRGNAASAAAVFAPRPVAAPTISGEARAGKTLTATDGQWQRDPAALTRAWLRCDAGGEQCQAIPGATAATYALADADAGTRLRIRVTATNAGGTEHATSASTPVVAARSTQSPPATTVAPSIAGTARIDELLTAGPGAWTGEENAYTYQWLRCTSATACTELPGETAATYRLEGADATRTMRVRVTATGDGGAATATTAPTAAVERRSFTQLLCSNPDTGYGVGTDGVLPDGITKAGAWQAGWSLRSSCGAGVKMDLTRGVRIDGVSTSSTSVWTTYGGYFQFRPLPGITMAPQGGTIYRRIAFGGGTKLAEAVHYSSNPALYSQPWQERCSQLYGGCAPGSTATSPATPYTGTALQLSGAGGPGFGFTAYLACEGNAMGSCTATGSTSFALYGGRMHLQDPTPPTVSSAGGSLVTGGVVAGDGANVTLTAADSGAGLYRVRVRVDEQEVAAGVIDANGGRCADAGAGNADDYEFAGQKPCPAAVSDARVEFDTSSWPQGSRRLHVVLEDAGGNTVTLAKRAVQIG